jgi:hypothetical protein
MKDRLESVQHLRALASAVAGPEVGGASVFCRPYQCSLTNSYVDDNSSLISE